MSTSARGRSRRFYRWSDCLQRDDSGAVCSRKGHYCNSHLVSPHRARFLHTLGLQRTWMGFSHFVWSRNQSTVKNELFCWSDNGKCSLCYDTNRARIRARTAQMVHHSTRAPFSQFWSILRLAVLSQSPLNYRAGGHFATGASPSKLGREVTLPPWELCPLLVLSPHPHSFPLQLLSQFGHLTHNFLC